MAASRLEGRHAEVRELLEAGTENTEVAQRFGVGEASVRRFVTRHGIVKPDAAPAHHRDLPVMVEREEIPVFFRDYSHLDKLHLYPLGDVHKGAPTHMVDTWRKWLGYLAATRHASMLGTGDFFNAALKDSKSESYDETHTIQKARRELREELAPLAAEGRLDGLGDGNHEDRIYRAIGDSPVAVVAEMLDVPYVPASALFVYTVGAQQYEVYYRHGTGNGQSPVALTRGAGIFPTADVHITGHTHRQIVFPEDFFIRDGDRAIRRHRYYISSGSFLGLEDYAAKRGYSPTRIGAPRVRLDGRVHDVKASV